jgi:hypothetical protein
MGGEIGATLLGVAAAQTSAVLADARHERNDLRDKLEACQKELTDCKIRLATLEARADQERTTRNLKNLAITFGAILLSWGASLYGTQLEKYSYLVLPIGALLFLSGWLPTKAGDSKQ